MRDAFEKESLVTGKRRLILTAALAGDRETYPVEYYIDRFMKDLDFAILITHDFNYNIDQCINTSPIYGDSPTDTRNIKYAVDYYLRMGIPRNKLIISIPMCGRVFFLSNIENHFYRAHTRGPYSESSITHDLDGLVAYFEVCRWQDVGWLIGRHQGFPYVSHTTLWASYEDTESIRYKVMFAKRRGLAGIAYWSVDLDDIKKQWCKMYDKNLMETADETCRIQIPMSRTPNNITPEMIDTKLCTHLIYAFAHIKRNVLSPSLPTDDDTPWTEGMYTRFNRIKEKSPHIITLLSVGGWDFGGQRFSTAVSHRRVRRIFIYNAIGFLRLRKFDGLDLLWQYPQFRGFGVTPLSFRVTPLSFDVTPFRFGVTPSSFCVTPSSFGVTISSFGVTP
ncbi:Oviduct-specific glycoprotein [Bulinus truncatus]|nr:Oviduct-specific glycoprotein [Bulinus truncatus]